MKRPVSLSDRQLLLIKHAARALPVSAREQFLQNVARHLAGQPSDIEITQAINTALNRTPVFLCDAQQPKEKVT
jgi:hypothetical protein